MPMNVNVTTRKLGVEDAALLQQVALNAYCDHYLHLWHDAGAWYIEKSFTTQQLAHELADPNAAFYLAYHQQQPVGFLKLNIHAPLPGEESIPALECERIYLVKEATRKGIGNVLLQLTFTIARQYNKQIVWLKAMDSSEASIAFYQSMGFEIVGTYTLPFLVMKEELRGMVIMKKQL